VDFFGIRKSLFLLVMDCKRQPPCKARRFCHCAVLEAAGWCRVCRSTDCRCGERDWDDFLYCDRCEGRFACFCGLNRENIKIDIDVVTEQRSSP